MIGHVPDASFGEPTSFEALVSQMSSYHQPLGYIPATSSPLSHQHVIQHCLSVYNLLVMSAGGHPSKHPKLIRHIHSETVDQVNTRHCNFSLQANGNFSLQTSYLSASRPAIEEEQVLSQQDIGVDSDPWNETQFSQEIEDPQSHLDGPTQARRRRTPGVSLYVFYCITFLIIF
jgi:hypothetical protein